MAIGNEGGGQLLLGIANKPPRPVVGTNAFANPGKTAFSLLNKLAFRVDIEEVAHPNGRVLVCHIPPRPFRRPFHVDGRYYMRSGESLVAMTPEQLEKIFREGGSYRRVAVVASVLLLAALVCLAGYEYWASTHLPRLHDRDKSLQENYTTSDATTAVVKRAEHESAPKKSRGSNPGQSLENAHTTEATRRQNVLVTLRNEYILSHDNLSPALIAGTEQPPPDWVNSRLRQLGEKWTVNVPSPADVVIRFVYPTNEVAINLENNSGDTVARDPKYAPGVWDLDSPDLNQPLQIPVQTGDYIRPKEMWGPNQFLGVPASLQRIKTGDRLFGFVTATCSNCSRSRFYWLFVKYGTGGWYAEESRPINLAGLAKDIPSIAKSSDVELAALVPEKNRIRIR